MPKLDAGDGILLAGLGVLGVGLWMLSPWALLVGAGMLLMILGLNHRGEI